MINQELKDLVIQEATNLKIHARKDELAKLDIKRLDPESYSGCVYGQITGNCTNKRAIELIGLCCERVYTPGKENYFDTTIGATLNGAPSGRESGRIGFYSPIELYITKKEQNDKLVAFLKDETQTLEL